MAKETTTVQCYPSDSAVNRKIRDYEAFGWELISNQRCQESGGTFGGYEHLSTFNKLTFTREKSAPWYGEVVRLEDEYKRLINAEPYQKKPSKILLIASIFALIFAFGLLIPTIVMLSGGEFMIVPGVPAIVLTVLGVTLAVLYGVKKSRYKKEYRKDFREWEQTCKSEAVTLQRKAETLVNGK